VELLPEHDGAGLLVRLEQRLDGDVQRTGVLVGLHGEVEDDVIDGTYIQPRMQASGWDQVGSAGRAASVPSMCPNRPYLAQRAVKNAFHFE
jgi:hypothetical protein